MSKNRVMVVEDDSDISTMLRIYLTGQGYIVDVAARGGDALAMTKRHLPQLVVLDINLPDMSGYDVCRELRTTTRTSHIPIIFLTQKDERSDKLIGLELGADDYITKPFDIEELKLRIQNAIATAQRGKQIDATSGLPLGGLIEEHLRTLMQSNRDWTYVDIKLNNFSMFSEVYGWTAGDEVIRSVTLLLSEMIDAYGTPDDYPGHPGRDNFVLITHSNQIDTLLENLTSRFAHDIKQHYSFIDRERGYMLVPSESGETRVDLMSMSVGMVGTRTHQFSDIREVTELAAEDRRRRRSGDFSAGAQDTSFLTSW
ncbi:response regulator [Aggregatilineales bacterium SYSU G02658]